MNDKNLEILARRIARGDAKAANSALEVIEAKTGRLERVEALQAESTKAKRRIKRLIDVIRGLLDMHEEWNADFDGFYAVVQAERALKAEESETGAAKPRKRKGCTRA